MVTRGTLINWLYGTTGLQLLFLADTVMYQAGVMPKTKKRFAESGWRQRDQLAGTRKCKSLTGNLNAQHVMWRRRTISLPPKTIPLSPCSRSVPPIVLLTKYLRQHHYFKAAKHIVNTTVNPPGSLRILLEPLRLVRIQLTKLSLCFYTSIWFFQLFEKVHTLLCSKKLWAQRMNPTFTQFQHPYAVATHWAKSRNRLTVQENRYSCVQERQ